MMQWISEQKNKVFDIITTLLSFRPTFPFSLGAVPFVFFPFGLNITPCTVRITIIKIKSLLYIVA
jgi:hypothetical protein